MGTLSSVTPTSPCCCSHYGAQLSNLSKNSIFSVPRFKNRNPIYNVKLSSSVATRLQVSASSTIGARNEGGEATASFGVVGKNDLLIVGPGVLGRLVAEKWREEHPGCQVYGQTMTTDHHDELIKMGINPSLKGTKTQQFPYVIFCAPPSRTSDYPGDVRMAALSWNGDGSFLFTSSSAPFDCSDNGPCDEDTPVVPIGRSPKTDVLLKAEQVVLEFGGCVVRLAGLYKADRGAHTYWLNKGTVEARPDHILNLIHYEDAASLSVTILKKKFRGRIFLGCDNHPLSRQETMDLVNRSGKFSKKFEAFTGTDGPLGKKLNNSKTRQELGWEPKYPSFAHFLGVPEYGTLEGAVFFDAAISMDLVEWDNKQDVPMLYYSLLNTIIRVFKSTNDVMKQATEERSAMGKVCCGASSDDNGGTDPMLVLMVIVICLVALVVGCKSSRPPPCYRVYRCRFCCFSPCRC